MSDIQGKIIAVDDEPHQRTIMGEAIRALGYECVAVETGLQALGKLRSGTYDVLVTDLQMPAMDGIRLLEQALEIDAGLSVILVTAHGTVETAVEAMKKGAEDYLLKPLEFSALEIVLGRVFGKRALVRENRKLQQENENLKRNLGIKYHLSNTLGRSQQAQALLARIQACMGDRTPLLVLGETGVGLEDIARMLHYNGPWANSDLIFFDCASVPADLQEMHLFGEEEPEGGIPRPGLIEKAHLSTLVLANFHRLNRKLEAKIARLLVEEKTQRIGGKRFYQVGARVIATSDPREFEKAAGEGMRLDLRELFTANVLEVAPLRERREDIPILIAAAARQAGLSLGKEISRIDPAVVEKLSAYDFPGNVKELNSLVESAVMRCEGSVLKLEDFSFSL